VASASSLSHRRKLARAKGHIEDVEALLAGWSSDGYRTFEKPNGEGRFVLYAEQLQPLPCDLPLVIGDTFQYLRHSLDHIVFALSRKNPAMTAQDEDIPSFPIYDGAVRDGAKAISFLDQTARDDVRGLAPDPARQALDQDPLWLLNKMSNRDKHREIVISPIARSDADTLILYESDGTDYFRGFGAKQLQPGAGPVALLELARSPGVKAEIGHSVKVIFDQGVEVADRQVVATLRWFHEHIRDTVFQRLEAHL